MHDPKMDCINRNEFKDSVSEKKYSTKTFTDCKTSSEGKLSIRDFVRALVVSSGDPIIAMNRGLELMKLSDNPKIFLKALLFQVADKYANHPNYRHVISEIDARKDGVIPENAKADFESKHEYGKQQAKIYETIEIITSNFDRTVSSNHSLISPIQSTIDSAPILSNSSFSDLANSGGGGGAFIFSNSADTKTVFSIDQNFAPVEYLSENKKEPLESNNSISHNSTSETQTIDFENNEPPKKYHQKEFTGVVISETYFLNETQYDNSNQKVESVNHNLLSNSYKNILSSEVIFTKLVTKLNPVIRMQKPLLQSDIISFQLLNKIKNIFTKNKQNKLKSPSSIYIVSEVKTVSSNSKTDKKNEVSSQKAKPKKNTESSNKKSETRSNETKTDTISKILNTLRSKHALNQNPIKSLDKKNQESKEKENKVSDKNKLQSKKENKEVNSEKKSQIKKIENKKQENKKTETEPSKGMSITINLVATNLPAVVQQKSIDPSSPKNIIQSKPNLPQIRKERSALAFLLLSKKKK